MFVDVVFVVREAAVAIWINAKVVPNDLGAIWNKLLTKDLHWKILWQSVKEFF